MNTCLSLADGICQANGYTGDKTVQLGTRTVSDRQIARTAAAAFVRRQAQPEFQMVVGGNDRQTRKENNRRQKALKAAVARDVGDTYGVSIPTNALLMALGLGLLIFGGPMYLLLCVIGAVFENLLDKKLNGEQFALDEAYGAMVREES